MADDTRPLEKLFAGARLRRLRRERGLTQADAAQALGVSASYLNLLERNQRPVTARVLLALAENFDVDVRAFANESDQQLIADLQEASADPVLHGFELDRLELNELADSHPRAAEAFARLYQTYRETSAATADLATRMSGPGSTLESVRDAIDASQNHYPELEAAAMDLLERSGTRRRDRDRTLAKYLLEEHGFTVRVLDEDMMAGARRRLDFHGRRLLLSEVLPSTSRAFHMGVALANLECGELIDGLIAKANLPGDDSKRLYRLGLANYLAGAIQMPYEPFLAAAEECRYDLYVLQRRFEASYEQVCHRLTTLQRSGARGLPFFMIRVDGAGNVSKRFGGGIMPFVRSGGGCPKWNLYDALRLPERIHAQSFELPDGRRFLSLARGQISPAPAGQPPVLHAIALGCDWDHASRIIHADPLSDSAPQALGIACRLCERSDCAQRAFPPINRKLDVEPHVLGGSPYGFDPTS
ncbi:short-chain fatty acyl-CoA regulator family protein [Maricaulis sp.]|uniref:helix-turn-helix domain-containing protein n=1 Tax=Maricaulis sp. TaxID=1486257 RepID=UPI00262F4990|nr:short-chain fatty acyl-CoA regulator family protein [Maricaulis sp.]